MHECLTQFNFFSEDIRFQTVPWEKVEDPIIENLTWDVPLHCRIRLTSSVIRSAIAVSRSLYIENCFNVLFEELNITTSANLDGQASLKLLEDPIQILSPFIRQLMDRRRRSVKVNIPLHTQTHGIKP